MIRLWLLSVALTLGACSTQAALLVDGGTTTGGSTTGGSSSGGASTGGTSAGIQPLAVTLENMQALNCSDGCGHPAGSTGQANWMIYGNAASLTLRAGGADLPTPGLECPPDATVTPGCCVAPLSSFQALDAGCAGSASVALIPDGSVVVDPAACAAAFSGHPYDYYLGSPADLSGTTSQGNRWAAAVVLPSPSVTFDSYRRPLPCPVLSLSGGAVLAWTPTTDARIHAVRIDATIDGGGVMRIACVATEDAGTLGVPGSILGHLAGATTVDIFAYDVADHLIDAGDTPIDIRSATSVWNPYNSADHFGPCTLSP